MVAAASSDFTRVGLHAAVQLSWSLLCVLQVAVASALASTSVVSVCLYRAYRLAKAPLPTVGCAGKLCLIRLHCLARQRHGHAVKGALVDASAQRHAVGPTQAAVNRVDRENLRCDTDE